MGVVTTAFGAPIGIKDATQSVGPRGPLLLQDVNFLDEMSHFDRERIPERVVHAKGAGAFGYFEVTDPEIQKYSAAKLFSQVGKRTPIAVRFSTVGGESGSADTVRDPRGFAMKFYTEDGIWDLVGNNTPIFFIRDPILFPSFIHTQKRNPATHLKDADMFWDFISLRPETTHQVMILFSDRGIPDGYRHMNGYGSHTFKLINDKGEPIYTKFHFKTNQKIKNLDVERAHELSASDPDYSIRDLYNAIAKGDYPSWSVKIQVMNYDQAQSAPFNPFDVTKVWPQGEYPLIPVGQFTLDRNPNNYFAEVEQIAFSPANLVPGIEPSPDKMLQGKRSATLLFNLSLPQINFSIFHQQVVCSLTRTPNVTVWEEITCNYQSIARTECRPKTINAMDHCASMTTKAVSVEHVGSTWRVNCDRFNSMFFLFHFPRCSKLLPELVQRPSRMRTCTQAPSTRTCHW